ncbi:dioxygenase family protein [Acidithiobacillus sulfuriphilus]|uniref:dioxygenase family protein n=1 Tax=Acidithiobacillus sulfuriphilus TaxID=1867749 RepID=UPI003F63D924
MNRLPVLYISHGAPTFALHPGRVGSLLHDLGKRLPRPRAILIISPHWMTNVLRIGCNPRPITIHDFSGFPNALYRLSYPAIGSPEVAHEISDYLQEKGLFPEPDFLRGLDHGVWAPLLLLFPEADIPVIPISLPANWQSNNVKALGEVLRPLADEGVLIIGSGSLTHNLADFRSNASADDLAYVSRFSSWVRDEVSRGDLDGLMRWETHSDAKRAHPTPEHFLPLIFSASAAHHPWKVEILEGGVDYGMLAMDSYIFW